MKDLISNLGGTKFIYAMGSMIVGVVLVLNNKVPADLYFEFLKWIGAMYVISNVSASAVEKIPSAK